MSGRCEQGMWMGWKGMGLGTIRWVGRFKINIKVSYLSG